MFNFKSHPAIKSLALLFFIVLFLNAPQPVFAQDSTTGAPTDTIALPVQDGRIMLQQIFTLPDSSISKERILLALKEYLIITYHTDRFDLDDKEGGKLVLRATYQSERKKNASLVINFTLSFTVKNGKYRIQVYNLDGKELEFDAFSNKPDPYLPEIAHDYEKMNSEYIADVKKPFFRRKYAADVLTRTKYVIKAAMAGIHLGVLKNLVSNGSSNDNF